MKQQSVYIVDKDGEDGLHIKDNISKYLRKWPWFIASIGLCILLGLIYLRYAPIVFVTEAKIKIIDDSQEFDIATDALSLLGAGSSINLENEIAVLKSYRLLDQVVGALDLDLEYYEIGNVKSQRIFRTPFIVTKLGLENNIDESITYELSFTNGLFKITRPDGSIVELNDKKLEFNAGGFPIAITKNYEHQDILNRDIDFLVKIVNRKTAVLHLMDKIVVKPTSDKSDVIAIKMVNENPILSEAIINELVNKFNADGITDRQLVSKRTLDFIDERFFYLSEELDSIEGDKQNFKQSNNLSFIQADAGLTIEKKAVTEQEVFRIETQIALSKLLMETLGSANSFELLPADIGVENVNINSLVFEYNEAILQREKLITSAGVNNPTVQLLSSQIENARQNISNTISTYQNQLSLSLSKLQQQKYSAASRFSQLPEKEKTLRAITRQQGIKENLFLLLLQKREEASINFAVTAPSIKVVDYGLTELDPISPKKTLVIGIAGVLGLLVPLAFFFTKFAFDTKVKSKIDLERLVGKTPILAEIPALKDPKALFTINERSMKAEAFRILSTNTNFLLDSSQELGQTIFVTSSLKNDGKTVIAVNLAIAFSSLMKKVLLIGADLRNPQIHQYYSLDKDHSGLSNILSDQDTSRDCIINTPENPYLSICLSGPIPPNATQLLAGGNFKLFLDEVRREYDYVIVDTAPTIQVADTLLISNHANLTIYVVRSGITDKKLVELSKELNDASKLSNMAYVLNDVSIKNGPGYNYGYGYGYGADT